MTEAEWLSGENLKGMLDILYGKATERKLRLFACACCRRIPAYLQSEPDRRGLQLTELDVDVPVPVEDFLNLQEVWDVRWYRRDGWNAVARSLECYRMNIFDSPNLREASVQERERASDLGTAKLAFLLRDVFGNPFRTASINQTWFAWNDGAIRKVAQAIYDGRAFDRLPLLADALEEAGCTDADILGHCRGGGEHVRGCWVVDLLLGKG
jgi:hypothetical protein